MSVRCACLVMAEFILTTIVPAAFAQQEDGFCGSALRPEEVDALLAQQRAGAYDPPFVPRHFLDVPIACHAVRRANGTGGISVQNIDRAIVDANAAFAPAGIQFYRLGSVRSINNGTLFAEVPNDQGARDALRRDAPVANAVNCYFVPNLVGLGGESSFTFSSVQGILMDNEAMPPWNNSTFSHELGHYFDLFHTHETAFGVECPDGSNCAGAGDLLCDTPADPNLRDRVSAACVYTNPAGDISCNGVFRSYAPQTGNVMSYSRSDCRSFFTTGQHLRALATLVNLRASLAGATLNGVTWGDSSYTSTQRGTYAAPYRTFSSAVNATANSGTVVLKPGSYPGPITISRPLTIDSFRGEATIGR